MINAPREQTSLMSRLQLLLRGENNYTDTAAECVTSCDVTSCDVTVIPFAYDIFNRYNECTDFLWKYTKALY